MINRGIALRLCTVQYITRSGKGRSDHPFGYMHIQQKKISKVYGWTHDTVDVLKFLFGREIRESDHMLWIRSFPQEAPQIQFFH